MLPYQTMAAIYDDLVDDIDYDIWLNYIKESLLTYGATPYKALEIGSGTGKMTERLLRLGYHITVLEPAEAMLSILQEKLASKMGKLTFFNGPLKSFNTVNSYDIAFAFLDVLNYIKPNQLAFFFNRLSQLLKPHSLVFVDWSTHYKLSTVIGDATFAESHQDFAYIWENCFDSETKCLQFDFTSFIERQDGYYEKNLEHHIQYAYDFSDIKSAFEPYFNCIKHVGDNYKILTNSDMRNHLILEVK